MQKGNHESDLKRSVLAVHAASAALSVITLELSLIGRVFLILAAESPSGREFGVSEVNCLCAEGRGG